MKSVSPEFMVKTERLTLGRGFLGATYPFRLVGQRSPRVLFGAHKARLLFACCFLVLGNCIPVTSDVPT